MLKRNVKNCFSVKPPIISGGMTVEEIVTSSEIRDGGDVLNRVSLQNVPAKEVGKRISVIKREDYTLENLIKAGVDLSQINLKGYMDVSDLGNVADHYEDISVNKFDKLMDAENDRINKNSSVNNENNEVKNEIEK